MTATVPGWLARPWPGWWRVVDASDGGPHLLQPVDHAACGLPAVPDLPAGRWAA